MHMRLLLSFSIINANNKSMCVCILQVKVKHISFEQRAQF